MGIMRTMTVVASPSVELLQPFPPGSECCRGTGNLNPTAVEVARCTANEVWSRAVRRRTVRTSGQNGAPWVLSLAATWRMLWMIEMMTELPSSEFNLVELRELIVTVLWYCGAQ